MRVSVEENQWARWLKQIAWVVAGSTGVVLCAIAVLALFTPAMDDAVGHLVNKTVATAMKIALAFGFISWVCWVVFIRIVPSKRARPSVKSWLLVNISLVILVLALSWMILFGV